MCGEKRKNESVPSPPGEAVARGAGYGVLFKLSAFTSGLKPNLRRVHNSVAPNSALHPPPTLEERRAELAAYLTELRQGKE